MITRRQFIQTSVRVGAGATVTLLLTPIGCGDDDAAMPATTISPTSPGACDGVASRSTNVEAHTHEICVPLADLTNPQPAGATYVTTLVDGHTHNLIVTQAELQSINRGEVVIVTTTSAESPSHLPHSHSFTLAKVIQPSDPSKGSSSGAPKGPSAPY